MEVNIVLSVDHSGGTGYLVLGAAALLAFSLAVQEESRGKQQRSCLSVLVAPVVVIGGEGVGGHRILIHRPFVRGGRMECCLEFRHWLATLGDWVDRPEGLGAVPIGAGLG